MVTIIIMYRALKMVLIKTGSIKRQSLALMAFLFNNLWEHSRLLFNLGLWILLDLYYILLFDRRSVWPLQIFIDDILDDIITKDLRIRIRIRSGAKSKLLQLRFKIVYFKIVVLEFLQEPNEILIVHIYFLLLILTI